MVGFRNAGRLGNFLYQCAATINYAFKHGLEYSVPDNTRNSVGCPVYLQHLVHPRYIQGMEEILINELWNTMQHYQEIRFEEFWRQQQIVLNGYWQSYKYIDPYRDEIIKAFCYPYERNDRVCSIHVRRGDYVFLPRVHPVVTEVYLWSAINRIYNDTKISRFLVHSDDIDWCKSVFGSGENGLQFEYSGKAPEQDLISMANCEHQICSNSTLALWGAELNQNPNKIVIVPDENNWFGIDNQAKMTVKDLFRPEWIRIKYKLIYEL